jgi:hypothetical protein
MFNAYTNPSDVETVCTRAVRDASPVCKEFLMWVWMQTVGTSDHLPQNGGEQHLYICLGDDEKKRGCRGRPQVVKVGSCVTWTFLTVRVRSQDQFGQSGPRIWIISEFKLWLHLTCEVWTLLTMTLVTIAIGHIPLLCTRVDSCQRRMWCEYVSNDYHWDLPMTGKGSKYILAANTSEEKCKDPQMWNVCRVWEWAAVLTTVYWQWTRPWTYDFVASHPHESRLVRG